MSNKVVGLFIMAVLSWLLSWVIVSMLAKWGMRPTVPIPLLATFTGSVLWGLFLRRLGVPPPPPPIPSQTDPLGEK